MIPTMILFGLALGRWWRSALVAAAVFLPTVAWLGGAIETPGEVLVSAALGVANAAVGIAVHQVVLYATRRWG